MTRRKRNLLLVSLAGAVLAWHPAVAQTVRPMGPGQGNENIWGGQHVSLEVTKTGAELEFDCATGSIREPLPVDKTGRFRLKGTFTQEHGGPVRKEEPPATREATYSGTIEDGTMRLRIEFGGDQESAPEYVLKRGQPGRVLKCR